MLEEECLQHLVASLSSTPLKAAEVPDALSSPLQTLCTVLALRHQYGPFCWLSAEHGHQDLALRPAAKALRDQQPRIIVEAEVTISNLTVIARRSLAPVV